MSEEAVEGGEEEAEAPNLLKDNPLRHVERQNAELAARLAALEAASGDLQQKYSSAISTAYDREIDKLKAQISEANKEGNFDLAESLRDKISDLKDGRKSVKEVPVKKAPALQDNPIVAEWVRENPWYDVNSNPELVHLTNGIAERLAREHPGLRGTKEFMDTLKERVIAFVPDKFGKKRKKEGSPVESSGESVSGVKQAGKGQSYADLPPEAKAICDKLVNTKRIKDKETYCKHYFGEVERQKGMGQ